MVVVFALLFCCFEVLLWVVGFGVCVWVGWRLVLICCLAGLSLGLRCGLLVKVEMFGGWLVECCVV